MADMNERDRSIAGRTIALSQQLGIQLYDHFVSEGAEVHRSPKVFVHLADLAELADRYHALVDRVVAAEEQRTVDAEAATRTARHDDISVLNEVCPFWAHLHTGAGA